MCNYISAESHLFYFQYVAEGAVSLEVVCFIGVGLSMLALLVTFIILVSFKHIQCNSNTILINLVFVIFLAELAFVVGVYRVETKVTTILYSYIFFNDLSNNYLLVFLLFILHLLCWKIFWSVVKMHYMEKSIHISKF